MLETAKVTVPGAWQAATAGGKLNQPKEEVLRLPRLGWNPNCLVRCHRDNYFAQPVPALLLPPGSGGNVLPYGRSGEDDRMDWLLHINVAGSSK